MKVVILAGGYGTRISEESHLRPKPMVEIGGAPILWHIMKCYSCYGFNEFVICCGYMGNKIKEYFSDYYLYRSDITFDFTRNNEMVVHNNVAEPWKVTLVDTGLDTQTGGRVKRIQKYVDNETFMLTYGDGISDVNIADLLKYHQKHDKTVTLTAVQPGGRYGVLEIGDNNIVENFNEKGKEDGGWINAGFMVVNPEIFSYISGDEVAFERGPLVELAKEGDIAAYKYDGYWQCMDTLRDKNRLEALWNTGKAPWKVW